MKILLAMLFILIANPVFAVQTCCDSDTTSPRQWTQDEINFAAIMGQSVANNGGCNVQPPTKTTSGDIITLCYEDPACTDICAVTTEQNLIDWLDWFLFCDAEHITQLEAYQLTLRTEAESLLHEIENEQPQWREMIDSTDPDEKAGAFDTMDKQLRVEAIRCEIGPTFTGWGGQCTSNFVFTCSRTEPTIP